MEENSVVNDMQGIQVAVNRCTRPLLSTADHLQPLTFLTAKAWFKMFLNLPVTDTLREQQNLKNQSLKEKIHFTWFNQDQTKQLHSLWIKNEERKMILLDITLYLHNTFHLWFYQSILPIVINPEKNHMR